ncbi:MAG: DUF4476 domain-containing protein [Flavobacteriales bacterium]|nr:DUF4476 domain-containing protein [Flavobacteriales bacterium]
MIKKITLVAVASFALSNVFAQMNAVIYSEAGEKFTLYLNGEPMNSTPQANVKLQGLTSEFYQARVDFQDAALADFSNNNFALHPGMEVTYQVKKNKKGEYVLRYYTENPISSGATTNNPSNDNAKDFAVADDAPANTTQTQNNTGTVNSGNTNTNTNTTTTTTVTGTNTKPTTGGNVGLNINVDGVNMGMNVNVNETPNATGGSVGMNVNADGVNFGMNVNVNETNSTTTGGNVGMNINVDGMNMGINMNVPNMDVQTTGTTTTTTRTTTSTSSSNSTVPAHTTRPSEPSPTQPSNTTISGNGNCTRSMDDASFGKAKQTIASKGFDETRLSTAKQVAKANCLTTEQIVAIMKIFGFDETRLEFAKYAYDYCFDKNNYYTVSEGFSFYSSTEELIQYIETK